MVARWTHWTRCTDSDIGFANQHFLLVMSNKRPLCAFDTRLLGTLKIIFRCTKQKIKLKSIVTLCSFLLKDNFFAHWTPPLSIGNDREQICKVKIVPNGTNFAHWTPPYVKIY